MGEYQTIQGDTWDIIAVRVWGTESPTGVLIAANPAHAGTVIFPSNVKLNVPDLPDPEPSDNLPPWRR